jgi:hypothetical protein
MYNSERECEHGDEQLPINGYLSLADGYSRPFDDEEGVINKDPRQRDL